MRAPSPGPRLTARLVLARPALVVGGIVLPLGAAERRARVMSPTMPFLMIPMPRTGMRRSPSIVAAMDARDYLDPAPTLAANPAPPLE